MRRFGFRRGIAAVLSVAALLAGGLLGMPTASADDFDPGATPLTGYAPAGPHETETTQALSPCGSLYAVWNGLGHLFGNHSDMPCTKAFPAGLDAMIGVDFYYPKDISTMSRVPTIVWVPGFTNNPGNYDASARLWASWGYVVAIPYDFFNSTHEAPLMAAAALSKANHDAGNIFHGKLDLSRTVIGGHSGGGGAAIDGASLPPNVYQAIDPEFRIIGAVPTESSPYATTFLLGVPTLFLAGSADFIVPEFLPRWTEYEMSFNAPAFIACLRGASHFTPWDDVAHDPMSGITLAWFRYLIDGDKTAASYFVGPDWKLRTDPGLTYALRNGRADHLPA
ncbi:alpha/beta hydrolase [Nocardia transvalensis]|uniref:poly(ethylene terephthalate) hydrolase family protein n=1 Tax=Nocardia transvalensis TaxID=37333 RepID=UPI0018945889|nr:alpha/beta hydrolase [Nocardia transvalensis]MBF6333253.1 alpha/beta hydrolase [Nocardia transvalensis]